MIHIIKHAYAERAACGEDFEEAVVLGGSKTHEANCEACRDECEVELGELDPTPRKIVCKYTVTLFTASPLCEKERDYLENAIETFTHGAAQANVPAKYDEVDAEEYELGHLLDDED